MIPKGNRSWKPRLDWLRTIALAWDSDECLLWPFTVDRDGYGRIKDGGFETRSHRMIFKLKFGRWPDPCALHSCDNPGCCNLRHISEGTNKRNQREKAERGRSLRGIQQHSAKLTNNDAIFIRERYATRRYGDVRRMAETYGVSRVVIRLIGQGKLWRHA